MYVIMNIEKKKRKNIGTHIRKKKEYRNTYISMQIKKFNIYIHIVTYAWSLH